MTAMIDTAARGELSEPLPPALAELMPVPGANTVSPAELMSARLVLEPALIDMVIGNATAADFARMDECNLRAEAATTLEEFERWDAALHEAVAEAAHDVRDHEAEEADHAAERGGGPHEQRHREQGEPLRADEVDAERRGGVAAELQRVEVEAQPQAQRRAGQEGQERGL